MDTNPPSVSASLIANSAGQGRRSRGQAPRHSKKAAANDSPQCLTAKSIVHLHLPKMPQEDVWDTKLKRFGIRVSRSGKHVWIIAASLIQRGVRKPPTRVKIGVVAKGGTPKDHPPSATHVEKASDILTLKQARDRAHRWIRAFGNGDDPRVPAQQALAKALTDSNHLFRDVAARFLESRSGTLRPRTIATYRSLLQSPFLAELQNRPIGAITRLEVNAVTRKCRDCKFPVQANRIRTIIVILINWALQEGEIESSKCHHLPKMEKPLPRGRYLDEDEPADVWTAAQEVGGVFEAPLKLLMVLGQRENEVAGMCWSELKNLDADRPYWRIPGTRTKNGLEHIVPLPPLAVEIIRRIPKRAGIDLLFSTTGMTPISGWSRTKERIDRYIDEQRTASGRLPMLPWTIHDLRRSLRTNLSRLKVREEVAEAVLNHVKLGMVRVYNQWMYEEEKRDALLKHEVFIRTQLNPADPGAVVALARPFSRHSKSQMAGSSQESAVRETSQFDLGDITAPTPDSSPTPLKRPHRALADQLVQARKSDGSVFTRAEIERHLIDKCGISRNAAQSAATKAVAKLDPNNPARRTRRRPIARRVDEDVRLRIRDLADSGMPRKEIAAQIGAHIRTVRRHLSSLSNRTHS